MPLVISDQRCILFHHEYVPITTKDGFDNSVPGFAAKELDQVLLEAGVQKQVPDWVLKNDHFLLLEKDGKAQSIA